MGCHRNLGLSNRGFILSKASTGRLLLMLAAVTLSRGASAQNSLTVGNPSPFPSTQVGSSTAPQNVTLTIVSSGPVVFKSIALAPGSTDFTLGAVTGCTVDGTSQNVSPQVCTIPVTFTPTLPGNASAQLPIARSASILIKDVENGTPNAYAIPLTGGGYGSKMVVMPGLISDLVGNDQAPAASQTGYAGDGGPASGAVFNGPLAMAIDGGGNIYIADTGNCVIRRIDGTTHVVKTIAGVAPSPSPNCGAGTDGVAATASLLMAPTSAAVDAAGNVYIADSGNSAIRMVSIATGLIQTVAGTLGSPGFSGDAGAATSAQLTNPMGIAVDGMGDIFIADTGNYAVREVTASSGLINTVAGVGGQQGSGGGGGNNGPALTAVFKGPQAVAVDSQGRIFIADTAGAALRYVYMGILGSVFASGAPTNLSIDAGDNLYFTQSGDCNVYELNPGASSRIPFAIAGNGVCGVTGDGGFANTASLNTPQDLVVDGAGNLYILEAEGVRYVDNTGTSSNLNVNFGSVNIGVASLPQEFYIQDDDVSYLTNNNSQQLLVSLPTPPTPFSATSPQDQNGNYCTIGNFYLVAGGYCNFELVFTPQADGPATGNFVISANYSSLLATLNLSGTGTGSPPTATLTGGPLSFAGEVHHGAGTAQSLTLTNTSSVAPLTIASIQFFNEFMASYVGGFAETDNCGTSLAAGKSCTIMVTFSASTVGTVQQTLIVTDNTAAGTQTAALTGTGTESLATLAPTSLTFSTTQAVGTTSASQPLVLSNTGSAPLVISSIVPGGENPNQFVLNSSACGATLAANSSCNILISFAPTGSGTFNATLTVTDDSGGQFTGSTVTQTASFTGAAPAEVQKSTFLIANTTFAATPVGQTITQTASLTLTSANTVLKSIAFAPGFTEYSVGTITGCKIDGVTANPIGTICLIPVIFAPTQVGAYRNATLLVTTVESSLPVSYGFGFHGAGTGPLAVLTPGLIGPALAADGSGRDAPFTLPLSGMGGQATLASVGTMNGIAIDSANDLYVSDNLYGYIYKVNPAGIVNVYAGGGSGAKLSGDGGPAIDANLGTPGPLAVDTAGDLYVGESDSSSDLTIRRIDVATGNISTVIGGGSGCVGQIDAFGDGCLATQANLAFGGGSAITGMVFDPAGNLYFDTGTAGANVDNDIFDNYGGYGVHRVDAVTGIVTLYAGVVGSTEGTGADNGPALGAKIAPSALALDSSGDLLVVDSSVRVRKITPAGVISTLAGEYTGSHSTYLQASLCTGGPIDSAPTPVTGIPGPATAAGFCNLTGITVDPANDIYLVDNGASAIFRIDSGTGNILYVSGQNSELATLVVDQGDYNENFGNIDGNAFAASLKNPLDARLDGFGNLYLMESFNTRMINNSTAALDYTPFFNPNPPFGRETVAVGSVAGPLGVSVLDAGTAPLTFNSPYTSPTLFGITTDDYTRDTAAADCITTGTISTGTECGVNIDFTPTVVGSPVPGTQTINDNGAVPTQTVTLIGYSALNPGSVTLLPSILNFTTPLNTLSAAQSFTLSNGTMTALPITGITFGGPNAGEFAQTNNCNGSVAAGATCQIAVTFLPTANAQAVAQITVAYMVTSGGFSYASTSTANVAGQVGAPAPSPQAVLSSIPAFPNTLVGSTSAAQTVTLSNPGTAPLIISGISITGANPTDFALTTSPTNPCGTSLAAGGSCNINITFTPASTTTFTAMLSLVDNATGSPQTVILSGTGTAPQATLSPIPAFSNTPVSSTSAAQTVTLSNPGTAPLTITGISITGTNSTDFALTTSPTNPCGSSLAAGGSCNISITFTPASATTFNATLSVADNVTGSPQTLALSGTGTAPQATLSQIPAFSSTSVGTTSAVQTVTLSNPGTAPLTISGISITGANPTDFAETNNCGTSLGAGLNCTISVTFTPGSTTTFTASLSVADNITGSPQTTALSGTGTAPQVALSSIPAFPNTIVGSTSIAQTITLSNPGTAALAISGISITGANPTDFAETNNCGTSLGAGLNCTISITFTPASASNYSATLSVADNISGSPQTAALSGAGIAPQASLSAISAFPNTTVGSTSAPQTVTLSNPGTAPLTITGISVTGANPTDFAQTNNCGSTLAASSSCTISVTFTPASATAFNATLSVADNVTGSPQTAPLSGTGTPVPIPQAVLSPTTLTFASTVVGTTAPAQVITLSNPGTATLNISGISITGANPTDFAQTNNCGATLAVSANCSISVTFTPASATSFSAAISVADNAAGSPQTGSLSGTGITASTSTFTVAAATPTQTVQPGSAATFNLNVNPLGGSYNNLVTLSATGLPPGSTFTFTPPAVTPGASGAATVLSITTPSLLAQAAPHGRTPSGNAPLLATLAGIPLLGLYWRRRRNRTPPLLSVLLFSVLSLLPIAVLSGCAGGYFGPAPQTYTITVVGTSGSLQQSTTISLTIQ